MKLHVRDASTCSLPKIKLLLRLTPAAYNQASLLAEVSHLYLGGGDTEAAMLVFGQHVAVTSICIASRKDCSYFLRPPTGFNGGLAHSDALLLKNGSSYDLVKVTHRSSVSNRL